MYCIHCGSEVERDRDQFCTHCGNPVSTPPALVASKTDASVKKKKMKKGVVVSVVLLAAISLVALYVVFFTDAFKTREFFDQMFDGQKGSQEQPTSDIKDPSVGKQIVDKVMASSNPKGYAYNIFEDGTISVMSYDGSDVEHLQIPEKIDGRVLDRLSNKSFYFEKDLVSIILPNTLTSIGSNCFQGCSSLRRVDIPDSVDVIRKFAFYGCSSLEEVTLPASLRILGDGVFGRCEALKTLHYGGTLEDWEALTKDVHLGLDLSVVEMTFGE